MAKKHPKTPRSSGVIVFSTPSISGQNVIDNWSEHRAVQPEEIQYYGVSKKESKTVNASRVARVVGGSRAEPVSAASNPGLQL